MLVCGVGAVLLSLSPEVLKVFTPALAPHVTTITALIEQVVHIERRFLADVDHAASSASSSAALDAGGAGGQHQQTRLSR